ncbi:uncharacterized protein LOC120944208 [Rana temporaria]|uniref:uncharacterized protein LOC120944208 n=1 Tax=Rana temporaria TaxID=8407 RepID=UPI001AADFAAC|nr:uncharacterized protein LOC120944208 [Rana temporaria]
MFNRLLHFFVVPLSEEEIKKADECKQRTLNIFNDALKKKDALLLDNHVEFSDQEKPDGFPIIGTELVKDLIGQLQNVTFRRGRYQRMNAYVRPTDGDRIVYLCPQFWQQHEFLQLNSRPGTLIHKTSLLLGYKDAIEENTEKVKKSQQHKLCPISALLIQIAFSFFMNHQGSYIFGFYSCCGETSRDTVCEKSIMSSILRILYISKASLLSKEEGKMANEAKQRALNILNDALKKKDSLLVDDPEEFSKEKKLVLFPLIGTDLVKDLIGELQKVTFKRNKDPENETKMVAYVNKIAGDRTVYLSINFFEQSEFLQINSRPETLIHEVSHFLGYGHTIRENEEKLKTSPQHKLCPISVNKIETALSFLMNHSATYTDGSYSCCGETSRDTLCEKSIMTQRLRKMREILHRTGEPLDLPEVPQNLNEISDFNRLGCLGMMLLLEEISLLSIMEDFLEKLNSITTRPQVGAVPDASLIALPSAE